MVSGFSALALFFGHLHWAVRAVEDFLRRFDAAVLDALAVHALDQ